MCVGEDISVHIICAEKYTFEKHDHYSPLFLETNGPTASFLLVIWSLVLKHLFCGDTVFKKMKVFLN